MRNPNQQTIGEAIREFLKNFRLEDKITELKITDTWEKTMGPGIARYTQRISFKNNTLLIQLGSPALRQELSYGKSKIIKLINEALGTDEVKEIEFR